MVGCFEDSHEPSGFIKCGDFLNRSTRSLISTKSPFPQTVFSSAARDAIVQTDAFPTARAAISTALLSRSRRC